MAGFREFQTGEVLTAANVDDFLAKQAVMKFADATARDTALGTAVGGGNALREGMVAYLDDTDEVLFYDGSAWADVAPSPTWQAFTPSWNAGVTVGNGTYGNNRIAIVGDIGFLQMEFTLGSTSAVTGPMLLDGPFPRNIEGIYENRATYFDSNTATFYIGNVRNTASQVIGFEAINSSSTYASTTSTGANTPFTWATGDRLRINATFRLASA